MMASKFDPHLQTILDLRQAGRPWREIAAAIEAAGVRATTSEVHSYFLRRKKKMARITRELRPYQPPPAATVADPIRTAADAAAVLAARDAGQHKQPGKDTDDMPLDKITERDAEAARQPKKIEIKVFHPKPKTTNK
jgi:hypothetical protein